MAEQDIARVERNVKRLIGAGAKEADIDGYLASENLTPEAFRSALVEKPKAPMREYSTFDRATDALVQGPTFGFGDEIAAGARALSRKAGNVLGLTDKDADKSLGQVYDDRLAEIRGNMKAFREEHPVAATALEVTGGLATGAPGRTMAALVKPAGAIRNIAESAGVAGAAGAVSGFGAGEGGFENRLENAGITGGVGAVAGAALPAIAGVGGAIINRVANGFGWRQAEPAAVQQLLRAFERDKVPVQDAIKRLDDWQAAGAKPEMLFELGGENVRDLARAAAGVPGQAKQTAVTALEQRQAGQSGRIRSDMDAAFGPKAQNYYGELTDLDKTRQAVAAPLYEKAFARESVWSPRLQQFLEQPELQEGLKRGYAIQRREAVARGEPFDPTQMGVDLDAEGNILIQRVPNMRVLDMAKAGLDDMVEAAKNPTTGRLTRAGRSIDELRREYLNVLDDLNPDYKAARAAYSGPSQSMDALRMGRDIFKEDAEVTAGQIAKLSEGDREYFRAGVARAILDKAKSAPDGADKTKRFFGSEANREKIAAAFDDPKDFARFEAQTEREARMFRNAQHVSPRSGSQTNPREMGIEDLKSDVPTGVFRAFMDAPTAFSGTVNATKELYRLGQPRVSDTADALAPLLFSSDTGARNALLDLVNQQRIDQALLARRQRLGRNALVSASTAGAIGGGN